MRNEDVLFLYLFRREQPQRLTKSGLIATALRLRRYARWLIEAQSAPDR